MVIGKDLDEERQKIQIGFCFGQAEGIDFESGAVWADFDVAAFKQPGQMLKAAAKIEDKGVGIVFL